MNSNFAKFWESAHQMMDSFFARLPSLIVGVIVFLLFYVLSIVVSRVILRTTRKYRPNLGVVFARLTGAATILLGFLVAFSVVAPSFQAGDLIKILGISGVASDSPFKTYCRISLRACCCYGPSHFVSGMRSSWTTTKARWKRSKLGQRSSRPTMEGGQSSRTRICSLTPSRSIRRSTFVAGNTTWPQETVGT
jgi:hypothetical protein